ncbi:4-hydroxy-tetrahydrodipicolinate synthase [Intestinibacter sp.]|uniref:4-hydroxy-tetrahydrodipicolinate synthase n=1 Tax=Intestinibacter sp. TaxID=1965304 RepID=UPI002A759E89|nr:4-hydroxy-tetrahydrodipicolinate synthase [Intestinibacter sp.]MDY2736425.1 4-hydroxy-tetrahydrodipicolinate synthase [Intestinibacter sp.]MDY4574617.1 4-hydroxy-tetrahydrodipicolinate synthase [Intestinibacter sp.]
MLFQGSAVALVTPFTKENKVNYDKLEELVEFHIKNNTDAIVVCGTTGEASTLDDKEHVAAIKCVIDAVNKRIPVIAGTGGNDTEHSIMLSRIAENFGADGLLIINPYYNKGNKSGIKAHFTKIAQSVEIPIILYNVPSRTGVNLSPKLIAELAYGVENIVGIKEASGDMAQVAEIARLVDDNFSIYSGNDDSTLPLLSLGGAGVISVLANICPRESHDLVYSFLSGNVEKSRELQLNMKPLIDALFVEVNPVPVKTAMNLLGMDVGNLRLPLSHMEASNINLLKQELKNFGFDLK